MPDRPNFLLIMSDQHNSHVMGCAGDEVVRTPHLDGLAQRGVLFDSCYCPSPLCVPSRMSFMTSRHPSHNEVWSNQCMLPSDIPTFAHALGAAGYETVLAGRMHFVGPDQAHGFEKRPVGQLSPTYIGARNRAIPPELFPATGQTRPAVEISGPGRTGYQAYDEAVAEGSAEFLRCRPDSDRPFCLVAGFVLPHCPFICPPEDWEHYLERVTLPEIPDGYFGSLHPAVQLWRKSRGIEDLREDEIRRARAGYYGIVTHFDRQVGKLLSALDEAGLAEDTVVIYTSDHGEMAGENGMWWKSNFYEGSASVPLIVSWPGHLPEGESLPHVTNLVDLGPTVIDLAGGERLPDIDGRSLAPLLRGDTVDWLDETFSEHYPSHGVPPTRMIRQGPWKLVHYEGYQPQLLNLDDDPKEWNDLGEDPEHAGIRDELHARVLEGWSAARMEETLAERRRAHGILSAWYRAVQPPEPGQWVAGPEDNVYTDAMRLEP
jgi:choline-sulfatase